MVVSYAKCCCPIPGDDVMGYLTAGRGVVIHRNTCGNLSNFRKQPEKWIAVSWEKGIDRDFICQIQIETRNRTGVLAEVAATIADCAQTSNSRGTQATRRLFHPVSFLLSVKDRDHLARIMRNVRKMPNVCEYHAIAHSRHFWTPAMSKQAIHTDSAPAAIGTYSQAIRAGKLVFLPDRSHSFPTRWRLLTVILRRVHGKCFRIWKPSPKPQAAV